MCLQSQFAAGSSEFNPKVSGYTRSEMSGEECLSDMGELGETHDGGSGMDDGDGDSQEDEPGPSTPAGKLRPLGDHSSGTKGYGTD